MQQINDIHLPATKDIVFKSCVQDCKQNIQMRLNVTFYSIIWCMFISILQQMTKPELCNISKLGVASKTV